MTVTIIQCSDPRHVFQSCRGSLVTATCPARTRCGAAGGGIGTARGRSSPPSRRGERAGAAGVTKVLYPTTTTITSSTSDSITQHFTIRQPLKLLTHVTINIVSRQTNVKSIHCTKFLHEIHIPLQPQPELNYKMTPLNIQITSYPNAKLVMIFLQLNRKLLSIHHFIATQVTSFHVLSLNTKVNFP